VFEKMTVLILLALAVLVVMLITADAAPLPYKVLAAPFVISIDSI
jgi:hypothetical protein